MARSWISVRLRQSVNKFKQFLTYFLGATVFIAIGWFANTAYHLPRTSNNPISQIKPKPLEKYSFENLSEAYRQEVGPLDGGKIEIGSVIKDYDNFTAYEFTMEFSPGLSKNLKKVTGLINLPKTNDQRPVVVMFRGYVDQELYQIGMGTQRAGEYFARNGFITLSPDFLGYGLSDAADDNELVARFQRPATVLQLLVSLSSFQGVDPQKVAIWGHSNGGQIALTILEITGTNYPTTLWAPVSKPFPYSVLYYTDESEDRGKLIRRELAKFEEQYDVELYSLTNYFDRINASLQIHQGMADEAVPIAWSDNLVEQLSNLNLRIDYLKYPDYKIKDNFKLY